jgi:cell division protein FtsL
MSVIAEWLRGNVTDPKETVLRRHVTTLLVADLMLGIVLVWLSLMVQDTGYRIDNTNGLIEKLDLEYAELVAEIAQETSPERLRRLAEAELGLGVPQPGQVVTVDAQP